MKFSVATILAITGLVAALPAPELEARTGIAVVNLKFQGGPASYSLQVPADGNYYPTNNGLNINIIQTPDFNAYQNCEFHTAGEKALVQGVIDGVQSIAVGPPQPILGVTCHGTCIPNYSDCYRDGQYLGECCNGYCAANKCRAWY